MLRLGTAVRVLLVGTGGGVDGGTWGVSRTLTTFQNIGRHS